MTTAKHSVIAAVRSMKADASRPSLLTMITEDAMENPALPSASSEPCAKNAMGHDIKPRCISPHSKERLACDVVASADHRPSEMSDWVEALRTLLERTTTVDDLTSLNTFIDIRTQIRDEIFARVSTKEVELNELAAARDGEIAGLRDELHSQREESTKQMEIERQRSKEAMQLAESKYTELKRFVDVLRRSNTEAAERMCRELQAVREKVVHDTEQMERTSADRRVREQKAIIERLRIRLNHCENEEAQEREKYFQGCQEVCAKHEAQVSDICDSAHEILAQRLQEAERRAAEEIQRHESRCEDLERQLRDAHSHHGEAWWGKAHRRRRRKQ
eukprot:GEMP01033523.1.p1 GENE.GEMP01033523.1~~GEMP01033523.1.p1  ORF type:complete len:333 (+),score=84.33 GEMP01033523.1:554-1552(+)